MRAALCLLALLALAACIRTPPVEPVPRPVDRPAVLPEPTDAALRDPEGPSAPLRAYYRDVERSLLVQGLLRRDGGGTDTPFDADRLARTFLDLAFYEEYAPEAGISLAHQTESQLHRWAEPVRIETRFGGSVGAEQAASDRAEIAAFADRLARATRHPIATTEAEGNFVVFVVSEAERLALGPELRRLVPNLSGAALASVVNLPRSNYCVVFALDAGDTGRYSRAVALIRAEHPDLLRLSCFHEEIAQGLGLANDSPRARPSIFNDDEEFALLTTMDEYLLRMLYDPRLEPGMDIDEARPIVTEIAQELMRSGA